mgnify:CR=1 FL=1
MDETRGKFVLKAPYQPSGDQPQAIEALTKGVNAGMKGQVLLGVTGSGKTFTMASVIAQVQRPTLVIAHNKTLAAQLCSEFRAFFPDSAVEYFVSYYDYYQPEAYIASSDTYIEKDAAINEEIDRFVDIKMDISKTIARVRNENYRLILGEAVSVLYDLGTDLAGHALHQSLAPKDARARPGRGRPDSAGKEWVSVSYREAQQDGVTIRRSGNGSNRVLPAVPHLRKADILTQLHAKPQIHLRDVQGRRLRFEKSQEDRIVPLSSSEFPLMHT